MSPPAPLAVLRHLARVIAGAPRAREASLTVDERLQLDRAAVLGGRGPGASRSEILAHTRNRASIAGLPVVSQLELTARQTSRAREDADAMAEGIQRDVADLGVCVGRLTGAHRAQSTGRSGRPSRDGMVPGDVDECAFDG